MDHYGRVLFAVLFEHHHWLRRELADFQISVFLSHPVRLGRVSQTTRESRYQPPTGPLDAGG